MSFDWRKEYRRRFGPLPGETASPAGGGRQAGGGVDETDRPPTDDSPRAPPPAQPSSALPAQGLPPTRSGAGIQGADSGGHSPRRRLRMGRPRTNGDRDAAIVALAAGGATARQIHQQLALTVDITIVYTTIRAARATGALPASTRKARVTRAGIHARPAAAPAPPLLPSAALSVADEARLRDLVSRGIGVTAIAPMMGKRYAAIIGAMERLGLSRVAQP